MVYMKVVVMAFAMILVLAGMPASVLAQSETGLVGEWHFDGDAKDSSGNGNDGTVYGASFVEGKFGKALSFDGMNDYVEAENIFATPQSELTVEAWVYVKSFNHDKSTPLVSNWNVWNDANQKGYLLRAQSSSSGFTAWNFVIPEGNNSYTEASSSWIDDSVFSDHYSNKWLHVVGIFKSNQFMKIYLNGIKVASRTTNVPSQMAPDTASKDWIARTEINPGYFNGLIDEIRIYNRALNEEEVKAHYEQMPIALTIKKEASPYSIRQYQTTNVTIQIKNTGTSEIRDIEVVDSTNSNLELIGGDFPYPKKYNSLSPGELRDIQYILKTKESGTFILNPATVSYSDNTGNIKVVKSDPVSLTVVPSSEGLTEISPPSDIGSSSAVLLHGEKTDVVLGEDILLKLSAVNLITKPLMNVQVMIYPPSGMSVTGSEFVKSGAGIYTTNYTLNPGDGKDIEVHIRSNQIGDFNIEGRIVYYFGEDKEKAEDRTLTLPIKVRKEPGPPAPSYPNPKTPGFAGELTIIGILFVELFIKRIRAGGILL